MTAIIAQGAEAIITKQNNVITKNRIPKSYRLPILDEKIRKQRTKKEAKIIQKLQGIINIPKLINENKFELELEYIDGDRLSEKLNSYKKDKQFKVMKILAQEIAKLHDNHIIHGDLTTSNTILTEDNKIFIIDFGLSFVSERLEDKAVDLHLIKQALEAKHYQNFEELYKTFLKAYNPKDRQEIIAQLEKVELRGRYKH